jgi:hypothetical protein
MTNDILYDIIEQTIRHEFLVRPHQPIATAAHHIAQEVLTRIDEHNLKVTYRNTPYDGEISDEYDELE